MLNKEEVEISDIEIPIPLNTKLLERKYRDLYLRHKILLGKKQGLIERLEEEHTKAKTNYSNTLSPYQYGRLDVIEEILQLLEVANDN